MTEREHPAFERGLEAYESGRHFEAHEHWEDLWRAERDPARRRWLQGLIQIAAAAHKLRRMGDAVASSRLLGRALDKLRDAPEGTFGLRLGELCADVERARTAIEAVDSKRGPLDAWLPTIRRAP